MVLISYAAITNYQRQNGWKQHKFILHKFWRSEVQTQCCWAKAKISPGGSGERIRFSALSQPLGSPALLGLQPLTSSSKAATHIQDLPVSQSLTSAFVLTFSLPWPSHLPFTRTLVITLVPPRLSKIVTHLRVLSLVTSAKGLLPHKLTYLRFWGVGWNILGVLDSVYHSSFLYNHSDLKIVCEQGTHICTHSACVIMEVQHKRDYDFSSSPKPINIRLKKTLVKCAPAGRNAPLHGLYVYTLDGLKSDLAVKWNNWFYCISFQRQLIGVKNNMPRYAGPLWKPVSMYVELDYTCIKWGATQRDISHVHTRAHTHVQPSKWILSPKKDSLVHTRCEISNYYLISFT